MKAACLSVSHAICGHLQGGAAAGRLSQPASRNSACRSDAGNTNSWSRPVRLLHICAHLESAVHAICIMSTIHSGCRMQMVRLSYLEFHEVGTYEVQGWK